MPGNCSLDRSSRTPSAYHQHTSHSVSRINVTPPHNMAIPDQSSLRNLVIYFGHCNTTSYKGVSLCGPLSRYRRSNLTLPFQLYPDSSTETPLVSSSLLYITLQVFSYSYSRFHLLQHLFFCHRGSVITFISSASRPALCKLSLNPNFYLK